MTQNGLITESVIFRGDGCACISTHNWVLTGVLVYEAIERVKYQSFHMNPKIMLITSGVGVLVNIM